MDDKVLEKYGEKKLEEYSHWIYVLECHSRFYCDSYDELVYKAEKRLDREPKWLRMAWEANEKLYIGQTENIHKRLGEHLQNKESSDFTTLFEPTHVNYLKPTHSRYQAERMEQSIGKSYYDNDDTFAYWY